MQMLTGIIILPWTVQRSVMFLEWWQLLQKLMSERCWAQALAGRNQEERMFQWFCSGGFEKEAEHWSSLEVVLGVSMEMTHAAVKGAMPLRTAELAPRLREPHPEVSTEINFWPFHRLPWVSHVFIDCFIFPLRRFELYCSYYLRRQRSL